MKKSLFKTVTLLFFLATLFSAHSQTAYDKLYLKGYNPGDFESMNLDGTGRTMIAAYPSNSAFGLEVDVLHEKVYWNDLNTNDIMRSNLDGTNPVVFIAGVTGAQGISIDFINEKLYWTSTNTNTIERINLDGTGRQVIVTSGFAGQPESIKVDETHQKIYWFDHTTYSMKRANTDGTGQEVFIGHTGGNVFQMDIDEVNSILYFPAMGPGHIKKINLDGTGETTIINSFSSVGWPYAFALDKVNGKMYWWDGDMYRLQMANIDGTNIQTLTYDIYSVVAMVIPTKRTPAVASQPSSSTICDGANTSFSVTANHTISYQWEVNTGSGFVNVPNTGVYSGATTSTLTITGATATMSGYTYRCVVTGYSSVNTNAATLTVNANVTYYQDFDNDGYGNISVSQVSCTGAPAGYVSNSTDCDDVDGNVNPGELEVCYDGIDNNCDGNIDENCVPLTQVKVTSCGATINYTDTYVIEADAVSGATTYEFRITNGTFVSTATNSIPEILMSQFPGYQYGVTYDIDVRSQVGSNWSGWGTSCLISTETNPVTEVQASQCGTTLPSISTPVFAYNIDGATSYRFRVTNGATVQTVDRAIRYFALNQLATYNYGTTYTVEVSVEVNGVYGPYGSACNVTMLPLKTKVQASQCGVTVANFGTVISANSVSGATQYRFRITNGANVQTIDKFVRSFSLNELPSYAYATTYTIDVAIEMNNSGSFGAYGTTCSVSTPAAPLTQVEAAQCGATLASLSTTINANTVADATEYRFRVTNGANVQTIDKMTRSFNMTELGSYAYATAYTVEVAVKTLGNWGAYGSACIVTTPGTTTKVRTAQCGVTLVSVSTTIYADVLADATQYRFRITNGANVQTIDRPTNSFNLSQLSSYGYGTTYTVDVSVELNGTFQAYGTACNISTPVITTKVQPSQCGVTLANIGTVISANNVLGATQYRFRVTNGANVQTFVSATRSFSLNQLATFASSTTYTIDVAVELNGSFGAYGTACSVTSPSFPLTQVDAAQCGTTLATISTAINADLVATATQYRFRVTNGANVQTIDRPTNSFNMTQLGSYAYSTAYTVEVAVRVSTSWGSYGPICHITTPVQATPTTQVRASQCGVTLVSIGTTILADNVSSATQYRFRVTNGASVQTIDKPTNSFAINQLATFAYGTTYTVDVAIEIAGIFGSYGPACTVTTPKLTTKIRAAQCGITLASVGTPIAANSVSGATLYRFRVNDGTLVQTIDKPGVSFSLTELGSYSLLTTYSIDVAVETNGSFGPYGPACNVSTGTSLPPMQPVAEKLMGDAANVEFEAITFPNPFSNEFGVSVSTESGEMISVTVYDMTGKILSVNTVSPQEIGNLHLGADFSSGIYQVQVVQGTDVKTLKVAKK